MESSEEKEETIANKYKIEEKIASNNTATVFLVKEKGSDKEYIAKVIKEINDENLGYFQREIDTLKFLKEKNVPNIIRYIEDGEGEVFRKGILYKSRRYFILEYAKNRDLCEYVINNIGGFGEPFGKIIFYKIVETIESLHNLGICHRDIKLENILFADKFVLKLCDFGFSTKNAQDLEEYIGTPQYASPENIFNIPYDGFKNDIFCLGVTLQNLVLGKPGLNEFKEYDKLYKKYIAGKNIDKEFEQLIERYWNIIDCNSKLSAQFKDLYKSMILFDPDKRPKIKTIKSHSWFKDMNYKNLEYELKKELERRLNIINSSKEPDFESPDKKGKVEEIEFIIAPGNKSWNELIFNENLEPKFVEKRMNMDYCIKMKGYLNGSLFMNSLFEKIEKKFGKDNCLIEPSKTKLKFNAVFLDNDEGNNEINNNLIKETNITIKIKLYKNKDGLFILKFNKIKGTKKKFVNKFKVISELVKQILNIDSNDN